MLGVPVTVNEDADVPSGVRVAAGVLVRVCVAEGIAVSLEGEVEIGMEMGAAVGGKNWLATGSPNKADATVEENKTSAKTSHCQPASM